MLHIAGELWLYDYLVVWLVGWWDGKKNLFLFFLLSIVGTMYVALFLWLVSLLV